MKHFNLQRILSIFSFGYFRYMISVRTRKSPFFFLLILFGCVCAVTLTGMSAYFFGLLEPSALRAEGISSDYDGGLIDTFVWSLKHILDPGAWSEDYSAPLMISLIGLINTVAGLVIIGALIGFVVNTIQNAMDDLRRGSIEVRETGHFLILGWNRKVLSILTFLEALDKKQAVVLLSNADVDMVSEEVRQVERNFKNITVIPQHGSPTLAPELERVAIRDSSSVVLLADELSTGKSKSNDIATIKSLMQLENLSWEGEGPNIVVEVCDKENLRLVELASGPKVPVVSSTDFVSKTLVQCLRYPGYASVYSEIFAFEENEIQIKRVNGLEGRLFGEVSDQIENSVLLGLSWIENKKGDQRRVAILNPEQDYDFGEDEDLILLGRSDSEPKFNREIAREVSAEFTEISLERFKLEKILILGWSDSVYQILVELDEHAVSQVEVTIVGGQPQDYCDHYFEDRNVGAFQHVDIVYKRGDTANIELIQGLNVSSYDVLLLLADESDHMYDPDSRTVLTLLILRQIKAESDGDFPDVVSEFYNRNTVGLCAETPLTDAVVSPEFVSVQLTHLAREPILASIYKELLSAGGIEIGFRPIKCYVPLDKPVSFLRLSQRAQQLNETALGIKYGQSGDLCLNPDKAKEFVFADSDLVVVLAQQIYT